jgi:O-antigen/teichoic acid export membrane protein
MSFRAADLKKIFPIAMSQTVGVACGLIGVRIISRIVPPAALGTYGVFLTFTTMGASFFHAGVVKFVGRHWARHFPQHAFVRTVAKAWLRKLPWLILGTLAAAFALERSGPSRFLETWPPLLIAVTGLSIGAVTQMALQSIRRNWSDFVVSASGSVTRTFAPPLLFLAVHGAMAGLYFGFCVHALCVSILGILLLKPFRATSAEPIDSKLSAIYEGPLFFFLSLAGWVLMGLNRWVAVAAFGDTIGGYYTLAGNIAQIIAAVLGAISVQFLQPQLYALADEGTDAAHRKLARWVDLAAVAVAIAGVLALIVLRLIAPYLVGPLIDQKYLLALEWLVPAGCFGLAVVIGQFFHIMLLAGRRERSCAPVDLSMAAILITGSIATAAISRTCFQTWLLTTPLLVLLLNRVLARHYYFRPQLASS